MNAAKYHGHHVWRRFRRQQLWRQLKANKTAFVSALILLTLGLLALLTPWISPFDPTDMQQQNIMDAELPPFGNWVMTAASCWAPMAWAEIS